MSKSKSLISSLDQFNADDGCQWSKWDPTNFLMEKFFVLGPRSFNSEEVSVISEFPEGCSKELSVGRFLFVDNLVFPDFVPPNQYLAEAHFCSTNEVHDEVILFKSEAGNPLYIYCLRFLATPFTRPAQLDSEIILTELEEYRNNKKLPQKLFALCIVSTHPFFKLYFSILRRILQLEAKARTSAQNLYMVNGSFEIVNKDLLWPNSAFSIRTLFLNQLQDVFLPYFSEDLIIYTNGMDNIEFKMPSIDGVNHSISLWSFEPLLSWIELSDFLSLLSSILLEQFIIVVGSKFESVIKTVTFLPQLIHPFMWVCPMISILPLNLFDIMESPMPNIVGLLSAYKDQVPPQSVIIDLDEKTLYFPENLPTLPFYGYINSLLEPLFSTTPKNRLNPKIALTVLRITQDFLESYFASPVLKSILTKVGNDNFEGTMFVADLFIKFFDEQHRKFIAQFIQTQLFNAFKEQRCREKTQLYLDDTASLQNRKTLFDEWAQSVSTSINKHVI